MGKQKVDLVMGNMGETHKEMEIQRGRITRICVFGFWYRHFDEDKLALTDGPVELVSE